MSKPAKSRQSAGKTVQTVRALAAPVVEECGLLLWDVRFVKEGVDWFLRVYIDAADRPVSIDDCVKVSRRLSDLLDDADPIDRSYCLEVSSPGVDRELTRPEHFEMFKGFPVVVRLYHARDGVKEFPGILDRLEDDTLWLQDAAGEALAFAKKEISAVHVIDDWDDEDEED